MKRRHLIKHLPLLALAPALKSCAGSGTGLGKLLPHYLVTTDMMLGQLLPHFPFKQDFQSLGSLSASNPQFSLIPEQNKVRIGLNLQTALSSSLSSLTGIPSLGALAGQKNSGSCQVACGLRYDSKTRGIHLNEPILEDLSLSGVPQYYTDQAKSLMNSFGPSLLDRYPVHTLEQSLASRVLQKMTVTNQGIALGFGII